MDMNDEQKSYDFTSGEFRPQSGQLLPHTPNDNVRRPLRSEKKRPKGTAKSRGHRQKLPRPSLTDQFRIRYMQRLRKVISVGKGAHGQTEPHPSKCVHCTDSSLNARKSELIWLELQAWYNNRTIFEQDGILYDTRQVVVPKVFSLVTMFEFNSRCMDLLGSCAREVDSLLTNMPQKCCDCDVFTRVSNSSIECSRPDTKCANGMSAGANLETLHVETVKDDGVGALLKDVHMSLLDKAVDEVGKILKLLCIVDNLYPSSSLLSKEYPCHEERQYQSKVESLCAWFNLVSDLRRKYSVFERTFLAMMSNSNGFEVSPCHLKQSATWPFMEKDFDSSVRRYTSHLLKRKSVKSVLRSFVTKHFVSLFRAKASMMSRSHYSETADSVHVEGEVSSCSMPGMILGRRLEQIDKVKRIMCEIDRILPDANVRISAAASYNEVFCYAAPISTPDHPTAVHNLPAIQPLFSFFPVVLFAVMKHCMCLRLEQSAPFFQNDEPISLLTSRQLTVELKEMLECALLSRDLVHFFMTGVHTDDEVCRCFNVMAECYNADLRAMLTVYLDFITTWLLRMACDLPHAPRELQYVLEAEWEFTNRISTRIHLETVLSGSNRFVKVSSDIVRSTQEFLTCAISALLESRCTRKCDGTSVVEDNSNCMEIPSSLPEHSKMNPQAGVLWFVRQISENPQFPNQTSSAMDQSADNLSSDLAVMAMGDAVEDSHSDTSNASLEDERRRFFVLCRSMKDLFTEVRERAVRVLRFGKCLRKHLAPAIGFNIGDWNSLSDIDVLACHYCNILDALAKNNYVLVDVAELWALLMDENKTKCSGDEQTLDLGNYWVFMTEHSVLTQGKSFGTDALLALKKLLFDHLQVTEGQWDDNPGDEEPMQCLLFLKKPSNATISLAGDAQFCITICRADEVSANGKRLRSNKKGRCGHDNGFEAHSSAEHYFTWSGKTCSVLDTNCEVEECIRVMKIACKNFELTHDVTAVLPLAASVGMARKELCRILGVSAKLIVGQMPVVKVLKNSFTTLNHEIISMCRSMMASVSSVADFLATFRSEGQTRVGSLDAVFGEQVTTETGEVLQSCYNCTFEVIEDALKVVSGEHRAELNEIHADFAKVWMRYVLKHREKGRGVKPRWASHGLSFLVCLDQAYLLAMEQDDFLSFQREIDAFIQHLIGVVPTGKSPHSSTSDSSRSSASHDPWFSSGVLRSLSNSSSCSPSDATLSEDCLKGRFDDADTTASTDDAPPIERVRSAIAEMEYSIHSRRYANNNIGRVASCAAEADQVINLGPRTANFRWQRGTKIGQGAFGRVFSCVNLDTSTILAMKEVRFQQNDHQKIKVALDEFSNFEGIKHRNLVQYYGVELHREEMYIFMEYCDGGTLAELGRIGLPEPMIRTYTSQILAAVHTLHVNGIIHRDIKGSNIFLTSAGIVKLGDFGSALKLNDRLKTATGEMVSYIGTTLAYTAPEVINSSDVGYGRASDIWSLGCVVIEMSSGSRPWRDLETFQIMYKVGLGHAPSVPKMLSDEGKKFVRVCTVPDPRTRWSAEQLLNHSFVKLASFDAW